MTHLKVAVRIRPPSSRERDELQSASSILSVENEKTVAITNVKVPEQNAGDSRERVRRFTFDLCFHENSSQDNVFQAVENVIGKAARSRCHSCVLAYGQSSSGKTHTMMGFPHDPGLIPRFCVKIFQYLEETLVGEEIEQAKISVSYLEIYNEKVRDLLCDKSRKTTSSSLKIRQHPKKGPYVQGLTEHYVSDSSNLLRVLEQGTANRRVASTITNPQSSRSHSVFVITFSGVKLTLVDLAGSERAGNRCYTTSSFREGANINKSLVALGNVISALAEDSLKFSKSARRARFIPYRDSVLTWLLKDTLGGNSDTVMIATISPSSACYSETVNTLRFGQRAKLIVSLPVVNEDPKEKTIRLLRAEIARLRELLKIGPLLMENPLDSMSTKPASEDKASTEKNVALVENSEQLIPSVVAVTAQKKDPPARLRRTFSVVQPAKNKPSSSSSASPKKFHSEEAISMKKTRKESIDKSSSTSSSSSWLKNTTPSSKKPEKSVATDSRPKIEPKVDSIRRPSLIKPRSQIVAAVTHRLYAKTKKKEASTDTSDIEQHNPESTATPKELMICSNARMKLKELTRKALKAHRSKNEETQTDMFPVLRVKEISTDSDDLRVIINEMKNAETSTRVLHMQDKGVECTFLTNFSQELSKHLNNVFTATRSCGTQSQEVKSKETSSPLSSSGGVSFTKYLRELQQDPKRFNSSDAATSNPIFTSAVNINISHNYINSSSHQRVSSESISDDSLDDSTQVCFPTPDLISNHNSLEPHAHAEASSLPKRDFDAKICVASSSILPDEQQQLSELQTEQISEVFGIARCETLPNCAETLASIHIPSVCAPETCIVGDVFDSFCQSFYATRPEMAQPSFVEYKTSVISDDCVTLLEPLVLKSIMKHQVECKKPLWEEDYQRDLPDSLEYHIANSKKVHFAGNFNSSVDQSERMFKAMTGFLEEATVLMNNLARASGVAAEGHEYEIQVSVDDISSWESNYLKRKRKSDVKCQTDDKHTKSNYVQTGNSSLPSVPEQFHVDSFEVPSNKYELLLEDSFRRLEEKIQEASQHPESDFNHFLDIPDEHNSWNLGAESLDSNARTFSDYGSLPRRRSRRKSSSSCSPSAFLRQLTNMRQQVVENSREEFFNNASFGQEP